mgnify:FL=1
MLRNNYKTPYRMMKKLKRSGLSLAGLIGMFVLAATTLSQAQTRYDELTFPEMSEFQQPEVETFTLDNGIEVFLLEDRELPLIDVSVIIRTGGVLVPAEKTGLASLAGTVMRSGGTTSYPADELNTLLENNAASMETSIGFTSGSASMNVLKEDFDELIPVFIDLLRHPAFPQDKIELAKTQTKSNISRRNDNSQQIAFREFGRVIYGANSLYSRNTEYETIDNIERQDLVDFHKKHFVGKNMMVGIVGDFNSRSMKKKLARSFGSIPAGTATELNFPEVNYDFTGGIHFIDKPDVNQSVVLMGHIGGMRENPDYARLQVMNQVLSGGFSGRLFQVVRSDLGLAYAVFGQYGMNSFYPGQFYAGVMTKSSTTAEAIDAIIAELKRLQNEPVGEEELRNTKDQFLNSLVFRYDSYEKILGSRMSDEYRGLSEDAFDTYVEGVRATTVQDIQEVARKYIRPESLRILVVGNKAEIGNQLEKYGEVNEIDITIPQPGDGGSEAVSGDAVKGKQLLKKMADAIIAPETEVSSLSLEGEVVQYNPQLPGGKMTLRTTSVVHYPDAVEQTIETPGGTMSLSYKDGSGTLTMMGQEQPLPAELSQNMKETLSRNYIAIALNHESLDPQSLGTEEFQGESYAKVNIRIDDKNIVFLINEDTGYPRLMRYKQFDPQQGKQVDVEEQYTGWTLSDGVSYAYTEVSFTDGEKSSEAIYKSHEVNGGE